MAYRTVVEEIPANLRRTVLGTFNFRGRSTRTELITYFFVPQMLIGLLLFVLNVIVLDLPIGASQEVGEIATLLLMIPLPALFVRRLHDQDRTGWWASLLLAAFFFEAVDGDRRLSFLSPAQSGTPWWLVIAFMATILALWVLSLWPPHDEGNRFGPNLRLNQQELPA